jgi:hypothetical protein
MNLTSQEKNDIVNALYHKARAERDAAQPILDDPNAAEGHVSLAKTLIAQAERNEKLAEKFEE